MSHLCKRDDAFILRFIDVCSLVLPILSSCCLQQTFLGVAEYLNAVLSTLFTFMNSRLRQMIQQRTTHPPPEAFPTVQKSVITASLHLSDLCYFRSDFKLIKACVLWSTCLISRQDKTTAFILTAWWCNIIIHRGRQLLVQHELWWPPG